MKALKGTAVIELTDVNTGETQTYTEKNMVTDAVNTLFGSNPMGAWFHIGEEYDEYMVWNNALLPICPNAIGGILLFSKALDEKTTNIYPSSDNLPVAYASNDVNNTKDNQRGSLNLTESKKLDNGYQFVWEFSPSQGNGTINALALTSKQGGVGGFGSSVADASVLLQVQRVKISDVAATTKIIYYEAVETDFKKGVMYSITFDKTVVKIKKVRMPTYDIGLNEKLDSKQYRLLEEKVLTPKTFKYVGSYTKQGVFVDGYDGYWYGFANEANSSGDATLYWIKIKKDDYTFTEGKWTLTGAKLQSAGSESISNPTIKRTLNCCVRNGYVYIPAYDKKGVYKISLSTQADVSLINLGFTSKVKSIGKTGEAQLNMVLLNDLIIGGDFQITKDDKAIHTQGSDRLECICNLMQDGVFAIGFGGSYGVEYRYALLLTPCLATINNLSQTITKNTEKTMKITYTLTEEAVQ